MEGLCNFNQNLFHADITNYVMEGGEDFSTPDKKGFRKIIDGNFLYC